MKNLKVLFLAASLILFFCGTSQASDKASQTFTLSVLNICVLGVSGNPSTLTVSAPKIGGETPDSPFDDSTYALYTSVVGATNTRSITAAWGLTDKAPAGCSLKLVVPEIAGLNEGKASAEITISSVAQNIIIGIGSCATGVGTDGAKLKYTLSVDTVTSLVAASAEKVTITLTLTDDA